MKAETQAGRWHSDSYRGAGFGQFYRDWQPREERCLPVLALHGSLTQSGMWSTLPDAAGGIRMLSPDQRGFGRSEDPGGDPCAEFAADALALARDLLPARYVVMGHSFACSIALEVARLATEHVAAAVLVDPVVRIGAPPGPPAAPSAPPETFASLEEAERHFRDTEEGEWTAETLRRFVRDIMIYDGERGPWRFPYTAARLRRLRAFTASAASDYDLFAKEKAVRCPVLVFRGGLSKRFAPAAEKPFLEAFASKPDLVMCPRSGHFPTATEPGIVGAALARFLDGRR
jgi:pimeloyl-ACP methyl ester carboxylesterase